MNRRSNNHDYETAVGKTDDSIVNKFGFNNDVDSAAEEIIASFGGVFDPNTAIMSTAQTFTITYNNLTDGLGQTGALSLLVTYLDENFKEVTATHVLGNTGSDVTSFTGLGINRCVVLSNGGVGWNVNDITITATSDATTQALIPALSSVTQQCIYHTEIGRNLLLDWLWINCLKITGSSPTVTIRAYSWSRVTETRYLIFKEKIDTSVENTVELRPNKPFPVGGREVIYFTAETDTNDTIVDLRFSGINFS